MPTDADTQGSVVIIGAGLAGLACAVKLTQAGQSVRVLEASDRVGGRVRSDVVDGFTLDHGFQVLLTAYPACRELLDYDSLRLQPFEPGALVRHGGRFSMLGDPWRRPTTAFATLTSPVGSFADKARIAKLRFDAGRGSLEQLFERPNMPTLERLERAGFSRPMIDQFFKPFLGGVYLDPSLQTSSRMLEFVFRMFSAGDIAVPADGMAAIPRQLADRLPRGVLSLNTSVESVRDGVVTLTSGESLRPAKIVVATESSAAARLLQTESLDTGWRTTTTHYFQADHSPDKRRMLMLAGDEYLRDASHRIGTVVVMSDVARAYAPPGKCLISVGMAESTGQASEPLDQELASVKRQLANWFGEPAIDGWQHLRTYRVPYGLPIVALERLERVRRQGDVLVCGDYLETPSINGAMQSGMATADEILKAVTAAGGA